MFSKLRRVILLLLTPSVIFLCIICLRGEFWHNSAKTIFYLTQQSESVQNVYSTFESEHANERKTPGESGEELVMLGDSPSSEESSFSTSELPNDMEINSILHKQKSPNFSKLRTFLLFIGYPRSGSTLFGSLLDAHPNMVIANEYNLLGKWKSNSKLRNDRTYIFNELWKNSVLESQGKQRAAHKKYYFSYFVPGLWQGSYQDQIEIIGDKRCTSTTRSLASPNSTRYNDLTEKIKLPIKFIHIIRNPFDNIATMTLRSGAQWLRMKAEKKSLMVNAPHILQRQMQLYFNLVDMNVKLRKKYAKDVLDVDYSSFIRQPKVWWKRICVFLEIHCSDHYINSVAKIVFKKETFTRRHIYWTDAIKQKIMKKIKNVSFLNGMKFEIS